MTQDWKLLPVRSTTFSSGDRFVLVDRDWIFTVSRIIDGLVEEVSPLKPYMAAHEVAHIDNMAATVADLQDDPGEGSLVDQILVSESYYTKATNNISELRKLRKYIKGSTNLQRLKKRNSGALEPTR